MKQSSTLSPKSFTSFHRALVLPDISPAHSPRVVKPENLIDCGLTRTDYLAQDRTKNTLSILNKRQSKDISYFYENIRVSPALSLLKDPSFYSLPSRIEDLKEILDSDEYKAENLLAKGKNQPSSRKDAENLAEWLEEMKNRYLGKLEFMIENKEIIDDETIATTELIFGLAFKEALKHTATNCFPRASMMMKVFDTLSYVWKKSNYITERKLEEVKNRNLVETEKLKSNYEEEINSLNCQIEELLKNASQMNKEKELLQNETSILKRHFSKPQIEPPKLIKELKSPTQLKYRHQFNHKYVQTEKLIEESEDESSSEDLKKVPETLSTEKLLSRQETKVQERNAEQLVFLKSKLELYGCTENFKAEELLSYVSKEFCDFYAWVDGFRIASEYYKKKIEEEEKKGTVEPVVASSPIIQSEVRSEEKKKSYKDSSKSVQSKLKCNNLTMAQYIAENSPTEHILAQFADLNIKKIEKISKMPYKKLSIQVSNFLNLFRAKSTENFSSFSVFVYSELFQKYSIKQFANRKFKELVACCVKHSSDAKIQIFLRMIEGGVCIGLNSFSPFECKLILKCYDFMYSDNTGIMTDIDTAEPIFFPTSRAIECIKQVQEGLIPKSEQKKLIKTIEEMSKTDPINRSGVIDIHAFVLASAGYYQKYIKKGYQAIKQVVTTLNEVNSLTLGEVHLLLRNIGGKKDLKNLLLDISQTDLVDVEEFCAICTAKGFLKVAEIQKFFMNGSEVVVEEVQNVKETVGEVMEKVEGICTLEFEEWESKLDDVLIWSKGKNTDKAFRLWNLLNSEYNYLVNAVSN